MTKNKALKEAQKRWGQRAAIEGPVKCYAYGNHTTPESHCFAGAAHAQPCPRGLPVFKVGKIVMGMFFEVIAVGSSWKDAFERADAKKAADEERYKKIEEGRR